MADVTQSGYTYAPLTGGVAAVVKDRSGVVGTIIATAAVTGAVTIYDNPSAASGQLIYTGTPTVGTPVRLDFPCRKGIFVTPGSAGTIVVSYS